MLARPLIVAIIISLVACPLYCQRRSCGDDFCGKTLCQQGTRGVNLTERLLVERGGEQCSGGQCHRRCGGTEGPESSEHEDRLPCDRPCSCSQCICGGALLEEEPRCEGNAENGWPLVLSGQQLASAERLIACLLFDRSDPGELRVNGRAISGRTLCCLYKTLLC